MFKNLKPHVVLLRTAAVLLVLVSVSTSMVAGRYARYTTTVTATGSARVAKFEVNGTGALLTENIAVSIIPGGSDETQFSVENASEVSVEYTIAVDNPYHNFPLGFQIKVNGVPHDLPYTAEMLPGQTINYTLVTAWTGNDYSLSYSGKVDLIEISVSATQID